MGKTFRRNVDGFLRDMMGRVDSIYGFWVMEPGLYDCCPAASQGNGIGTNRSIERK